jgi:hypothetical protein
MSDTITLSQLSPLSDCTVSVSPRWVIPVLYHSYHLVIDYRYHSSWWYWYSTVSDISDNCDRVHVSLILVILIQYSQRQVITVIEYRYHSSWLYTKMSDTCSLSQLSPMSLNTVSVSPRWVIPVLYHRYHLCLWLYCISITKMSDTCTLGDTDTVVRDIGDNCDRVQVSLILVILIQYSQRQKW